MAETKYTYNIIDFPNDKVDINKLENEIRESDITTALDYINSNASICDIWFKAELSILDSTATLPAIIAAHDGEHISDEEAPHMPDGRPIVRADTRPLFTETYFTMAGDSGTEIGAGQHLEWDFSDSTTNIYTGPEVPAGMKCKQVLMTFKCPVYLKDGTIYFFDTKFGSYIDMDVVVPAGNYYPNPEGTIPASALGLGGNGMYAYTSIDLSYQQYVNKHHMYGDCPMGDELNAEGCAINPVPPGWYARGLIIVPESDNSSKGFGSLEMYRCHTRLLPGQTFDNISHIY